MRDNQDNGVRHLVNDGIHYGRNRSNISKRNLRTMHFSTIKREGGKVPLSPTEKRQFKKKWKT